MVESVVAGGELVLYVRRGLGESRAELKLGQNHQTASPTTCKILSSVLKAHSANKMFALLSYLVHSPPNEVTARSIIARVTRFRC